ncbi:unnamed protein product [Protopolystoma xenopodis]|uniref:Uncharacterized protein n=1 Tax=Protopolystoma xenopodis TaxID=117903 RepID=A0A3S5AHS1_9PLAT|nr:unnamed protein product [Protopolystoma xenopodis]
MLRRLAISVSIPKMVCTVSGGFDVCSRVSANVCFMLQHFEGGQQPTFHHISGYPNQSRPLVTLSPFGDAPQTEMDTLRSATDNSVLGKSEIMSIPFG